MELRWHRDTKGGTAILQQKWIECITEPTRIIHRNEYNDYDNDVELVGGEWKEEWRNIEIVEGSNIKNDGEK